MESIICNNLFLTHTNVCVRETNYYLYVHVLILLLKKIEQTCNVASNFLFASLDRNYLTDACAQELCAVLRASHRLYSLDLEDNSFTENSVPFIQDLMKNCTTLTIVQ